MTIQHIEVRAISELYDAQARRIAREILQLPMQHLPSLSAIATSPQPLSIRTAHLYSLSGTLTPSQIDQLTHQLLIDPVIGTNFSASVAPTSLPHTDHIVDVFLHPGVTDTLAESVLVGTRMLGIAGLEQVQTGRRYILDARLSREDVHTITKALLYNPVIQYYFFHDGQNENIDVEAGAINQAPTTMTEELTIAETGAINQAPTTLASYGSLTGIAPDKSGTGAINRGPTTEGGFIVRTVPLGTMSDEALMQVSRAGLLALNLDEMHAIQKHYQQQGREPTDVELETLAQTWSEHCSHKTFKATIHYREVDARGQGIATETIPGLLKHYLMRATEQVKPDWLVSAFSDNAGIIRFTETHDIAFKVETHNHPSAIEPFGGANTGVGGVIRDVVGVSAQPIACTDILCFGPLDTSADALPDGVLSPRRIASGVVNGVRDYGNKMGIPTVNGAILYHSGYIFNPLVFCGCLGILPHGSHPNNVQTGDLIIALGGRTGRDGVHGATFSSGEMSRELNAQAGTAVQIGAPITEKQVTDVIIQARDQHLYHAITDCGAGGFSSAIGEMGAEIGARVELAQAPLKYQGLAPWEIWLSEAQERMVLAVPPDKLDNLLAICAIEEVEASILGTFTGDHRLTVHYQGQIVADMDMEFLHDGRPGRTLEAVWTRPVRAQMLIPTDNALRASNAQSVGEEVFIAPSSSPDVPTATTHYAPTLLALLRHPTIASKEEVVRRYDHEVQGATILKPLVGRSGNGPGDAAVLQPILGDQQTQAGIVLSNGVNPLYGKFDPYHMAINAVDEALRNLTAVGGNIEHVAILDNFCWGNPTDPHQLGMLVRAVKGCYDAALGFKTPFISGKDSLNNEYFLSEHLSEASAGGRNELRLYGGRNKDYRIDGQRIPVIPTLVISAVGVLENAAQTVDMSLKTPGNLLYQIGMTHNELLGSHYTEVIDPASFDLLLPGTNVPRVQIVRAYRIMKALGEAIRKGLVRSCHDLSEGGLAVAVAEMSLAGMLGVSLDISQIHLPSVGAGVDERRGEDPCGRPLIDIVRLFSESASRFLVEITPEQWGTFEKHMRLSGVQDLMYVGTVTNAPYLVVQNGETELINVSIAELQEAWKGGLA